MKMIKLTGTTPWHSVIPLATLMLTGVGAIASESNPTNNTTFAAHWQLQDLDGKTVNLADFKGKVVILDFWATWCPPCRKEMPDLEALYERFQSRGLVILGISDEEAAKVEPFTRERKVTFPVLLDPDRKVNDLFVVNGIPKSFVYDREGKFVAQSIDMRTQKQFLEMLGKAGIQ